MLNSIKKLIFGSNLDYTKAVAYVDSVLDDLHFDLNLEYSRMASVTNCYDHLFNTCRIRHLRNAIDEINALCDHFEKNDTVFDLVKKNIDNIAIQQVGCHAFENYLLGSRTPYKQVLSGQGDDSLLPDLAYTISFS